MGVKHQYGVMKPSMVENSGSTFPKLKGKAAEVRNIGKPLASVFEDLMDNGFQVHRTFRRGGGVQNARAERCSHASRNTLEHMF